MNLSAVHTCITKKVYAQFVSDGLDVTGSVGDDGLTSDDDDSSPAITARFQQSTQRATVVAVSTSSTIIPSSTSSSVASAPLQRNGSLSLSSLPPAIWKHPWVPPSGRYEGLFSLATLAEAVYDAATSGVNYKELEVRGVDVADLAAAFKKKVHEAVHRRDFTNIMSPGREFLV